MQTILVDPYPREMKLIFTPKKLQLLKKKYQLINAPNKNKQNFYEKNIAKADFIIGQPNLPSSLLLKAKKLFITGSNPLKNSGFINNFLKIKKLDNDALDNNIEVFYDAGSTLSS